jgi:hypothetical protein
MDCLLQFIVDDGVKKRGHRANIFNKDFTKFSCFGGKHKLLKWMVACSYA